MAYTVAKYLRISAEDIDLDGFDKYESNSIANQRDLLDDFIGRIPEFAGCKILEELDDGRTGTNFLRPGVQKLIDMAQSGKVQCIIVKDLSRWGRNYIEVGDFLEQKFPAWGVRFISLNDCYDSAKLCGATGGIDIAFRNLIYDLYSQDLSEKVRAGKISAAKRGNFSTAVAFYGYIKDPADSRKLVIDTPAAEVVKRIFELAAQDVTPNQIAKILNDDNVDTPQIRKMQLGYRRRWTNSDVSFWYGSIVSIIIRDERYTGKLIYGKTRMAELGKSKQVKVPESEWIVVPGAIPAIISDEQFKEANANVAKRHFPERKQSRSVLLFAQKLKCGYCGMAMKTVRRKNDLKYHCYTDKTKTGYGCSSDEWIFESDIAAAVFAALKQQIAFADEARELLETKAKQLAPSVEKMQGEITRLQKLVEKSKTAKLTLWERFKDGAITAEAYHRDSEKAEAQIQSYLVKIPELEERIRGLEMETGRENLFVERFSKQVGIQELTRKVVEDFIHEIKVYAGGRIEVVFNFADEYERIVPLLGGSKKRKKK